MSNNQSGVTAKILSCDRKTHQVLVEIPGNYPKFVAPDFQEYKRPLTKWTPHYVQFWMGYAPGNFQRIVQFLRDGGYPVCRYQWAISKVPDEPDFSCVDDI
jgi:hypothetical protein